MSENIEVKAGEIEAKLPAIENHRLISILGSGATSFVYKAENLLTHRLVAIKVLRPDLTFNETAVRRFQQEVQVTAKLEHPNIVAVYSVGFTTEGQPYLAMELVEGTTLAERLKDGPLSQDEFKSIFLDVALALQYAHDAGVVHRDIKPSNIMQCSDGRVRVLDFGLAALSSVSDELKLTRTNVSVGTPLYMSPEQIVGAKVDGRADIYSLGYVMYQALSACQPLTASTDYELAMRKQSEQPPSIRLHLPDLPVNMAELIDRSICPKLEDRPQNMAEVIARLKDEYNLAAHGKLKRQKRQADSSNALRLRWMLASMACTVAIAVIAFTLWKTNADVAETNAPKEELPATLLITKAEQAYNEHRHDKANVLFAEGIASLQKSAVRPFELSRLRYAHWRFGHSLADSGHRQEAIEQLLKAEAIDAKFNDGESEGYIGLEQVELSLANLYASGDNLPVAKKHFAKFEQLSRQKGLIGLSFAYGQADFASMLCDHKDFEGGYALIKAAQKTPLYEGAIKDWMTVIEVRALAGLKRLKEMTKPLNELLARASETSQPVRSKLLQVAIDLLSVDRKGSVKIFEQLAKTSDGISASTAAVCLSSVEMLDNHPDVAEQRLRKFLNRSSVQFDDAGQKAYYRSRMKLQLAHALLMQGKRAESIQVVDEAKNLIVGATAMISAQSRKDSLTEISAAYKNLGEAQRQRAALDEANR